MEQESENDENVDKSPLPKREKPVEEISEEEKQMRLVSMFSTHSGIVISFTLRKGNSKIFLNLICVELKIQCSLYIF